MLFITCSKAILLLAVCLQFADGTELDLPSLRKEAYDMFMHGYKSYMNYAFPADELMPLSCKGRIRGVTPSRGNVDDILGNFSVTLIDSLDTLVVVGELDEFERAVDLVIHKVRFDSDLIVSVFETNIRILGGLISAHVLAEHVKQTYPERLQKYDNQLLKMATEVGNRLLPAFNTTSGLPYSRINLKYGMTDQLKMQKDTCTACGGTMILEFAALTKLTGNPIYEKKARKAMDFLWEQRHRDSDLMGTVLNVHSGDWVRRDSGIGAGIDSYYEYTLKAYILLGDESYLDRFNQHYEAIMRYINKGPLFVDVHMHRPTVTSKGFMDSLLAFWPGLQVLKGDVKEAIEMHEMLFQVIQKHKFLPEAFTHDFQVHWAEHPIRPEFVESTYFLYRATKDPHYLHVAKQIMDSINQYVKVPCGFAALKDIRTMIKEDQMESFVLSETFKYLYMIFTEPEDLIFDPDHYVLTTEAHFLPLSMGQNSDDVGNPRKLVLRSDEADTDNYECANPIDFTKLPTELEEAQLVREKTKILLKELGGPHRVAADGCDSQAERLKAFAFVPNNKDHIKQLAKMGIKVVMHSDGRIQMVHQSATAATEKMEKWGDEFMVELYEMINNGLPRDSNGNELYPMRDRFVQLVGAPHFGKPFFHACHAKFGKNMAVSTPVIGELAVTNPFRGCAPLLNAKQIAGRIAVLERSDCSFEVKARHAQAAGAIGVIILDHFKGTKFSTGNPTFSMIPDGDFKDDIRIAALFLYDTEGQILLNELKKYPKMMVSLTPIITPSKVLVEHFLKTGQSRTSPSHPFCKDTDGDVFLFSGYPEVIFNIRFNGVTADSDQKEQQEIVEQHVTWLSKYLIFDDESHHSVFYDLFRSAAYGVLDIAVNFPKAQTVLDSIRTIKKRRVPPSIEDFLPGEITSVRCVPKLEDMFCTVLAL